ncbi:MAG TPA: flagellar basal body P-ring formation chaperone FlgA [Rhodocyclaceae bacterium]|nr:flagellar basal body P-ring formation chaperone FlgA [Rhodocyclaceae bacterium]
MKHCPSHVLAAAVLFAVSATFAWGRQDPATVKNAVEMFLQSQTRGLPGEVSYTAGGLDPDNKLAPCSALEVALPAGAKAWGRTTIAVHCQTERGWTIFLPVHIRVVADYLVTALPIAQGQTISSRDLSRQKGDLSDLPAGVLTEEHEAVGRTSLLSIAAGRPIRSDMLRQPLVVQQNQTVKVVSRGPGFQVTNEGRALNNGQDGQVVNVRLANGQVVSGIARMGGVVEVGF